MSSGTFKSWFMPSKMEFRFEGSSIKVVEKKDHWEVRFSDGNKEKLYLHVNAAKQGIWMWESGRIDDSSLCIGRMIEQATWERRKDTGL
jgi:hypothetical protein